MQIFINIFLQFSVILIICTSFYLLYSLLKYFNISQAIIITIGAYFIYLFQSKFNLPFLVSIPLSILLSIVISLLSDILIFKPMRRQHLPSFVFLVTSIGLFTVLQNFISLYFGDDSKTISIGKISVGHQIFGAYITSIQIITIIVALVVFVGMYFLYNYTSLGKQIRAVSENSELSSIYGISSNKIILIVTAISSALASIAGILYAYDTNLTPTMGFNLLLYGIVAMIIGGVGSFRGLFFGSLLLATTQNLVAYYFDTKLMDASTYIILIAFLLLKPLGFSGKKLKKIEI